MCYLFAFCSYFQVLLLFDGDGGDIGGYAGDGGVAVVEGDAGDGG